MPVPGKSGYNRNMFASAYFFRETLGAWAPLQKGTSSYRMDWSLAGVRACSVMWSMKTKLGICAYQ
eukprot:6492267-Amphidinium_carterae.2